MHKLVRVQIKDLYVEAYSSVMWVYQGFLVSEQSLATELSIYPL